MSENVQIYAGSNQELSEKTPADIEPSLIHPPQGSDGDLLKDADLAVSRGLRKATYGEKELRLTSAEFNILEQLLRHRGNVLTREDLVQAALGRHLGALDRSVDVHISRLRKKLVESGAGDTHIRAIRGVGYIYTGFSNGQA